MPTPRRYVARNGRTTWRVRFRLGTLETSETFATEAEATVFCRDIADHGAEVAVSLIDDARNPQQSITLDQVFDRYATWSAGRVRSPRTVADYRRDYLRHISPTLGRRPAARITEADVQRLVDMLRVTLAPKTVVGIHGLLHAVYKYAIDPKRGLVERNPAIGTELPERAPRPPKGLRPAEWAALHTALHGVDPNAADLALFLLASGWRWSEAIALHPMDCYDGPHGMRVTMARVYRRTARGGQELVEGGKSAAALRTITLDVDASAMVQRRLTTASDLVFTTGGGAQWRYSNFRTRAWDSACRVAGLARRPSPHHLRHTHVAWMVQSGASLPELQSRVGHEHFATTLGVYGRAITDVRPDALSGFEALRSSAHAVQFLPQRVVPALGIGKLGQPAESSLEKDHRADSRMVTLSTDANARKVSMLGVP